MTNNQILIAEIKGAHGVKGLVRVAVFAENTTLFDDIKNPKITLKNRHKGDIWLAHIDGINDKDAADAMKGTKLYCDRSTLPDLPKDQIYYADLVGMKCVNENGNIIGTVKSVDNFGAGDILDIVPDNGGASFFLGFTDENIIKIDDAITVRLPEIL